MRVLLRTFGCRANHYDTEMVRAMAVKAGYEIVDDPAAADIAVFNSCAVTMEAERDVRKAVRRAARVNPGLKSVVMGCAAALPGSQPTLRGLPTVQHVVPAADPIAIARALAIAGDPLPLTLAQQGVRATLRIQDGCDEHCTFCATTIARGAHRSRSAADLIREAEALADAHPEIVITGTHIGSYGADCDSSLGALMETLLRAVPTVRFRLSSLEATEVDPRLVELFGSNAGLAPHLHAPLQSGSDRLLRRMGRHWYTSRTYADAVERLAAAMPVFGLGADVIVGFPGETDADFDATLSVVERLPFTYLHVFTYSPRHNTAALRLPDPVSPAVARERSARLREESRRKSEAHALRRSGSTADAIVISSGATREAMTEDFLTVRVATPHPRAYRFSATLEWDGESLTAV
jgi:threonylcarbamoyladenosine tRNA methylthiotransferase MtaB